MVLPLPQMMAIKDIIFYKFWVTWHHTDVSKNSGTPKSSILIGFSIVNHPFWGTLIFGNTHTLQVWKVSSKSTSNSFENDEMGGPVQADLAWHCHELRLSRLGDKPLLGSCLFHDGWGIWLGMLHLLKTFVFSWNSLILYLLSERMRIEICSMSTSQYIWAGRCPWTTSTNYCNYATIAQTVYPLPTPRPFSNCLWSKQLNCQVKLELALPIGAVSINIKLLPVLFFGLYPPKV